MDTDSNALKSNHPSPSPLGGPRTAQGKEVCSRNATRHGCCSTETLILPTEEIHQFHALQAAWFASYQPQDAAEHHLVDQLAVADWFLQRAIRHYAEVESRILAIAPNPLDWSEDHHKSLARFLRYRTAHANTVAKHRRAIEDHRRTRAGEIRREQIIKLNDQKLAGTQLRLKGQREKTAPPPSIDHLIEEMRQEGIRLGRIGPDSPRL